MNNYGPQKQPSSVSRINAQTTQVCRTMKALAAGKRRSTKTPTIGNLEYKIYAIVGGPWLEPSQKGCEAHKTHRKEVRKVRKKIEKVLGQKIEGLTYQLNNGKPGHTHSGFTAFVEIENYRNHGLKRGNKQLDNHYQPRADKSGRWLRDLLFSADHDGWQDYVFGDAFPYSHLFQITPQMRLINYIPRVSYTTKPKLNRAIVVLGYDSDIELEPRNLPEGLHELPHQTANKWLNGKINLE